MSATLAPAPTVTTIKIGNPCPHVGAWCENCECWSYVDYGETTCDMCGGDLDEGSVRLDVPCDCFELGLGYLREVLMERLPEGPWVHIEGRDMGWMHRSGWKVLLREEFLDNPFDAIAPNGPARQRWEITPDGGVEVCQSHHDAPVGEGYTVRVLGDDEVEEIFL